VSMVILRNFVVDILAITLLSFPVFISIQGIFLSQVGCNVFYQNVMIIN